MEEKQRQKMIPNSNEIRVHSTRIGLNFPKLSVARGGQSCSIEIFQWATENYIQ